MSQKPPAKPVPSKPPTMKDVARGAGVSVMTVSRAFKSDASITTATRDAIHAVAEELGYVFDATASSFRGQKSGFVAMTIPSINNANFADTVGGLSDELADEGRQVLLGSTGYDIVEEERLVEQLLRRRPEAIVVTGGRHTDRTRRLLYGAGIPVVEIWDLPEAPIDEVVGFSNAATMEEMADHLVAQGYARLAFIGGEGDGDTRGADRRRGFLNALRRHGLPTDMLVGSGNPPISMREGAQAMSALLDSGQQVDAVCCVSDLAAFGAMTECQRRGLRVPHDIAIAGFGAYELGDICLPTITTVDPNARQIGALAGQAILRRLGGTGTKPATLRTNPILLPRQSTRQLR